MRILFADGSRCVYRLSGTGSSGATIRVYVEQYASTGCDVPVTMAIKKLVEAALSISKLVELTGRGEPTVIT